MDKPLNVLVIDGGGVRGLSSLLILRSLMQQLRIKADLKADPLPCQVFDLICGTSSGGLTAIMLGRLRMSVEDAIERYRQFSKTVFSNKALFSWYRNLAGLAMYDASILEECTKEIVAGSDARHPDAPLLDPRNEKGCRTFVVAIPQSPADAPPVLFRSYINVHDDSPVASCKIWEAARATTAANTFFKPATFGEPPQTYLDGAFSGANNPSQLARNEAHDVFPGRPMGCFLSLGTGVPNVVAVRGGLAKIGEACHKLITSCELVAQNVGKDFRKETPEGQTNPFFRFSVNRGLEKMSLDEWDREQELTAITGGYMRFNDQREKANECVELLKTRADEIKGKQDDDALV